MSAETLYIIARLYGPGIPSPTVSAGYYSLENQRVKILVTDKPDPIEVCAVPTSDDDFDFYLAQHSANNTAPMPCKLYLFGKRASKNEVIDFLKQSSREVPQWITPLAFQKELMQSYITRHKYYRRLLNKFRVRATDGLALYPVVSNLNVADSFAAVRDRVTDKYAKQVLHDAFIAVTSEHFPSDQVRVRLQQVSLMFQLTFETWDALLDVDTRFADFHGERLFAMVRNALDEYRKFQLVTDTLPNLALA